MFLSICLSEHARVCFFQSSLSVNAHICRFISLSTYAHLCVHQLAFIFIATFTKELHTATAGIPFHYLLFL